MCNSQQGTAVSALVLDVLQRADTVWDTSETEAETEKCCNGVRSTTADCLGYGELANAAVGAVDGDGGALK